MIRLLAQINTRDVNLPNKRVSGGFVSERLADVLSLTFIILGSIAVLVITVAALQYVLSAGDPQKTARAKDTIIYAVIGLVVAVLAWAIVQFVLGRAFS